MSTIFLTGVTGFVGRELLRRRLKNSNEDRFFCLVRATDAEAADKRLDGVIQYLFSEDAEDFRGRVVAVRGDLLKEGLGIDAADRARIVDECDRVTHCAASVKLDEELEKSRASNLRGSEKMFALADQMQSEGSLERFDYVGTAYVAGDRTDLVKETELDVGQGFRNNYEQTKFESEKLVRSRMADMPICIHRPSIIVGDSQTGETSSFNVLYFPLRIFAKGWWNLVIGRADTPVDVVPIDFVADAIDYLSTRPESIGQCHHLTAGSERMSNVQEMMNLAADFFDVGKPRLVEPEFFWTHLEPRMAGQISATQAQMMKQAAQYLPYFAQNPVFDAGLADAILAPVGLQPPPVKDYFGTLFEYAQASDWGRKPPAARKSR